jgi:hypothetical protein
MIRYFPSSYVNKFDALDITNYNNDNNKKVNDTILYIKSLVACVRASDDVPR